MFWRKAKRIVELTAALKRERKTNEQLRSKLAIAEAELESIKTEKRRELQENCTCGIHKWRAGPTVAGFYGAFCLECGLMKWESMLRSEVEEKVKEHNEELEISNEEQSIAFR